MQKTPSESARIHPRVLTAFVLFSLAGLLAFISIAATPPAGTLNPAGPTINWVGTATGGASADESTCVDGINCDTYTLTLSGTPADWVGKKARITISAAVDPDLTDYDVFVHKGAGNGGPVIGSAAAGGTPPEVVELDPNQAGIGTGVFSVHVVYFAATAADQYSGSVSAVGGAPTPTPTPTPGGTATPTPTPVAGAPRYFNYYTAPGVADDAGEPSNGVNWNTENVVGRGVYKNTNRLTGTQNTIFNGGTSTYFGGFLPFMLRYTFDDCSSPAGTLIEQKTLVLANLPRAAGDPILFTDHITGRTLVAQEVALTPAGSTTDITDDDGETFQPSEGGAPSGVDHQTIGGGPWHLINGVEPPQSPLYPHAVYYASQSIAAATSATSFDGGITFPQQTPTLVALDCVGLHGHLKVAEDGTAFIPDKACAPLGLPLVTGGNPAVIVSEDNGLTWEARLVPGADSDGGVDDPAVGVSICPPAINPITGLAIPCDKAARSNTIYLGFMYTDGRPGVAVSNNKGVSWPKVVDIGALSGIKHIAFPEMVVGDPDRAAFAFFGTTTAGNYSAPEFPGIWHLYVANTYDGGTTWTVTNVTPGDPIQRGGICGDGTCRNLLDFFDAQTDKEGRIMLAGQDGCIGGCVNGGANSFTAKAFITRQAGGRRLFAAFDPIEPAVPGAPRLSGSVNPANTVVTLTWPVPDHSGSNITGYNVYRSTTQGGPYNVLPPIATVTETTFMDTTFNPAVQNYYIVTAVNALGESPFCNEFSPVAGVIVATRCELPGILVSNDVNPDGTNNDTGQNTPPDGSVNARQLFVAEPFIGSGTEQLFFTLQAAPSTTGTAPPNSQWFIIWQRQSGTMGDFDRAYVAMRTNAAGTPSFEYG